MYLFLERGGAREKERGRNINVWLPLTRPPPGASLQPRHVPWLEIKLWPFGSQSMLNTPSYASQGYNTTFKTRYYICMHIIYSTCKIKLSSHLLCINKFFPPPQKGPVSSCKCCKCLSYFSQNVTLYWAKASYLEGYWKQQGFLLHIRLTLHFNFRWCL